MTDLFLRMIEDRALRDSARRLLDADIDAVRADLAERGLGGRVMDRLAESAADMADEATDYALGHKGGLIAAVAGGAVLAGLWFWRDRIVDAACDLYGQWQGERQEQADCADRSPQD